MIIRYDKKGIVIAIADNCHEMARILGITPQAVSHGIHRKSKLYAFVEDDESVEE